MFVPAFFGLLLAASVSGQSVVITPAEAVRRVGEELTVFCKVNYPIDSCRMTVGTTPYRLLPSIQEGDVVYAGQGLKHGECGAQIKNIREEWNGNISCVLPPPSGSIELTATMRLLVARPPDVPQLESPVQAVFAEGEQFDAMCVVPHGRPAARLTWFLDDEPLLVGLHQPIVETEPNTDLQTIRQNVSRRLTADDAGRRLVCRAEHQAWSQPRDAARQLTVHYPPRRADGDDNNQLTVFGLRIGEEGRLNVTVRASPPPAAEWTIAGRTLTAPAHTEDNSIMALQPIPLGGGYYNVCLVLAGVGREDVARSYLLRARNELGAMDLVLRISTLDEPAGVELDAGAIVGIVVGVLVLILAISLVVFAKATDRWCFAGHREPGKSSGESALSVSSDTESAAGGRREARSRLAAVRDWGARVRAALPRPPALGRVNRDKVQASELAEEEKPGEEKKSVVYAELALSETPATAAAGERPPPPATEYAEIVYTDQGQKEAKE